MSGGKCGGESVHTGIKGEGFGWGGGSVELWVMDGLPRVWMASY